jgi:hypothetical protein
MTRVLLWTQFWFLRIRQWEVVRYDGLTTVPYPSYCLAVTRRRRIVVWLNKSSLFLVVWDGVRP